MESRARPSPRKYGFACLTCRSRKIRCDGEKPKCKNCLKASRDCHYSYRSSDQGTTRLYTDLRQAQARVEELEQSLRTLTLLEDQQDRDQYIAELAASLDGGGGGASDANESSLSARTPSSAVTDHPSGSSNHHHSHSHSHSHSTPHQVTELDQPELIIDARGELEYFGATSRFYTQLHRTAAGNGGSPSGPLSAIDVDYHKKWLVSNARFHASWRKSAYSSLSNDPELTVDAASILLDIYWTWQAPLHNCVYRNNFLRDMVLGGPYFSQFLLNVIFAHACRHAKPGDTRFERFEKGKYFLRKAKLLLVEELGVERPSVPTVQGLLILGGRQCAVGKNSEGWLYTGMAVRMIKDLGMHLHEGQGLLHSHLEPDDLEGAKRLYLSAYAWDKSISLCLGRPPSLPEMPYSPDCLLDDTDNEEMWRPTYMPDLETLYPPAKSYTTLTFKWFCRLSKFANDIYTTVYSGRRRNLQMQAILDLEERLHQFRRSLPDELRITDLDSLSFCPPPHILSLNVFWHTLMMLLFRPFFLWSTNPGLVTHDLTLRAKRICGESAIRVNEFFQTHGRTFSFRNQTYLMTYSVYTAATIELQQIRDPDPELAAMALQRLSTTLHMLESEAQQTPGIRKSIDIIRSHLSPPPSRQQQNDVHDPGWSGNGGNRETEATSSDKPVDSGEGQGQGGTAEQVATQAIPRPNISLGWGGFDQDHSAGIFPDGTHWTFYDMSLMPKASMPEDFSHTPAASENLYNIM